MISIMFKNANQNIEMLNIEDFQNIFAEKSEDYECEYEKELEEEEPKNRKNKESGLIK